MSTVYVVTRPRENKFGWTPDLSDATKYGKLQVIFEPDEKPQFNPSRAINIARVILQSFSEDDYLLWAGGGDPVAVMIACMVASENCDIVNVLRWGATSTRVSEIAVRVGTYQLRWICLKLFLFLFTLPIAILNTVCYIMYVDREKE